MERTILIAATPGDRGRAAVMLGVNLGRPLGAQIVLADVVRSTGAHTDDDLDAAIAQMQVFRADVPEDLPLSYEAIAAPSVLEGLHDLASEHEAELLVLNPDHRDLVGRALHGDFASKAISTAPCAVAIASGRPPTHPPRLIGVGWNGTPESYEALEWATQLAEHSDATVQILRALDARHPEGTEPEAGVRERANELRDLTRQRAQAEATLEWGDAAPLLVGMSRGLDLLVLGSRARTGRAHRARQRLQRRPAPRGVPRRRAAASRPRGLRLTGRSPLRALRR